MASSRPTFLSPFASTNLKNSSTVTTVATDGSEQDNDGEKSRRGSRIKSKLSKVISGGGSAPSSKPTSTATSRAPSTAPSATASETEELASSNDELTRPSSPRVDINEIEWLAGRKYILRVNAGPSYDASTHSQVQVNSGIPLTVESEHMSIKLHVRIRDYIGLPRGSRMSTPYFDSPQHKHDRYSISFSFIPKRDISSKELIWGNDFDHPIRDRLPPGFNTAFKIVKTFIDPGLSCDAYADEPWLYGPALSCWFVFRVGEKSKRSLPSTTTSTTHTSSSEAAGGGRDLAAAGDGDGDDKKEQPQNADENVKEEEEVEEEEEDVIISEGADDKSGADIRAQVGMPDAPEKRRKFFLSAENRAKLVFEQDRTYHVDFFNPYLDFNKFALRLPGFSLSVVKYIDDKTHNLRYVFKNQATGEVYLVVVFTLLFGQELLDAVRASAPSAEPAFPKQDDNNDNNDNNNDDDENDKHSTRSDASLD